MTEIRPAMNNTEMGSARSRAPRAAEVIGLRERNTVTRVGEAWPSAQSHM